MDSGNITYNGVVIDSHSHILFSERQSKDYFWGYVGSFHEYKVWAERLGIKHTVFIPPPTPQIGKREQFEVPVIWTEESGEIRYWKIKDSNFKENVERYPYEKINDIMISNFSEHKDVSIGVLHHPVFDDSEYLKLFISKDSVVGLKIHGVATNTTPENISPDVLELLEEYDKVFIAHTDYWNSSPESPLEKIYLKNSPKNWLDFAEKHRDIRFYFTHGLRGEKESIKKAVDIGNVRIGVSPSLLLSSQPQRLACKPENYLKNIFEYPEIAMFDLDYFWNVDKGRKEKEWGEKEKCLKAMSEMGTFTKNDVEKFFFKNSCECFKIQFLH